MAIPKHLTISFFYEKKQNRIFTPVNLHSVPFNSSLSLSINALWDTGASISAITPEIMKKLNLMSVDKKPISGVHGSQIVDLVLITVELPNGVIKKNVKVAVCNMTANADVIIGMDIISLGDFAK